MCIFFLHLGFYRVPATFSLSTRSGVRQSLLVRVCFLFISCSFCTQIFIGIKRIFLFFMIKWLLTTPLTQYPVSGFVSAPGEPVSVYRKVSNSTRHLLLSMMPRVEPSSQLSSQQRNLLKDLRLILCVLKTLLFTVKFLNTNQLCNLLDFKS